MHTLSHNRYIRYAFITAISVVGIYSFALSAYAAVDYAESARDSDFDGLTDQGEMQEFLTDPFNPDTDGDGYLDGAEILSGSDPLNSRSPQTGSADAVISLAEADATSGVTGGKWPWIIARVSGLVAYVLLFLIMLLGEAVKTGLTYRFMSPTTVWAVHKYFGIALSFVVLAHIVSLLFDDFLNFTLVELLVPMVSHFSPVLVSLGIIGLYLFAAIAVSSLWYLDKFPRFWRLLHYMGYPTFVLLFLHGVLIGTDTKLLLVQIMYWVTAGILSAFTIYRLRISYLINK